MRRGIKDLVGYCVSVKDRRGGVIGESYGGGGSWFKLRRRL